MAKALPKVMQLSTAACGAQATHLQTADGGKKMGVVFKNKVSTASVCGLFITHWWMHTGLGVCADLPAELAKNTEASFEE